MNKEFSCIFCSIINRNLSAAIIYEDTNFIVLMDKYPINVGHTLVIPKTHYENLLLMPHQLVGKLYHLVSIISQAVVTAVSADGFNIGQNNGRAANQIVPHVHVHIIPRFNDDSPNGRWPSRSLSPENSLNHLSQEIKKHLNLRSLSEIS